MTRDKAPAQDCRAAFVALIKDENFYRDAWARTSLKQHWTGPSGGFADERLQCRWNDFKRGWDASRASQAS